MRPARIELLSGGLFCISGRQKSFLTCLTSVSFRDAWCDILTLSETLALPKVKPSSNPADLFSMKSRPKSDKRIVSEKAPKSFVSFNFFQGCNTSACPDWGTEIVRFKLVRRRARSKD